MPPRTDTHTHESRSVSTWYGKLRHGQVKPNPTEKNLWEQVLYKPRKRKQNGKHTPHTPQQMHDQTSLLMTHPLGRVRGKTE